MSYSYNRNKKAKRKAKGEKWSKERNKRRNNKVEYSKSYLHTLNNEIVYGDHKDL